MLPNLRKKIMLKALHIGTYTILKIQIINMEQLLTIQSTEELDILKTCLKRKKMTMMMKNNYSK
jgi:hypothetical protein